MTAKDFLKPKNFKIKAQSLSFESVQFMTDLEKKKVYINFVKLLNNHFKNTLFKKNLYTHFYCNCGFIAHGNIHGFYGEYFETAARYHFNVNDYSTPISDYGGNMNIESTLSHGEQFYAIYEEINGTRSGLGEFYNSIMSNQNWGEDSDFKDLDDAIKNAFSEYMETWIEEIRKAVKAYGQFKKDEDVQILKAKQDEMKAKKKELDESMNAIEETLKDKAIEAETVKEKPKAKTQLSLFDFAA